MATVQNIIATVLIQVGADEPKPIGTIEIPIEISTGDKKPVMRFEAPLVDIDAGVEEALKRSKYRNVFE